MHRSILIFVLLVVSFVDAQAAGRFARIGDKKPAGLAEVVQEIEGADVIFVGEIHYSAQHHLAQLDIVRSLHAKKHKVALGLEMFMPEDQRTLDQWSEGKLDEGSFKQVYARNWSHDWQLYRDLFIFARDNHIPLIALNIPKGVIAKVVSQGGSALTEEQVPPKMSWELNESQSYYMGVIARQVFGGVPSPRLLARLSEAQALRNTGMAWNIARYRKQHAATKIVVLAGIWHAVKNGVPAQLALYDKLAVRVLIPELAEFNLENATVGEADYLILKSGGEGKGQHPD